MAQHAQTLAMYWAFLDLVLPKAFAKYEPEYLDGTKLPGRALAGTVQALLWHLAESPVIENSTLRLVPRASSKHLVDEDSGMSVRIRRHPWNFRLNRPVQVIPAPVYTLFGIDASSLPFELAILWTANRVSKSLGSASLAAVHGFDGSSPPDIYFTKPLPQIDLLSTQTKESLADAADQIPDDFDEFFPEEDFGTDDPA